MIARRGRLARRAFSAAAAAVLAGLLGSACERRPAADARLPDAGWRPPATPAEHTAGAALFAANCVACHGEHALGTTQGPPLLHPYYEPGHHADAAFLRAIAFGVQAHHWRFGSMPPVPGVNAEQAAAITAYVRWLQREAGIY